MSVELGQLSLLLTAALFIPILGFLVVVKPQAGLPVAAAIRDRRALAIAALIGVILVVMSLAILPRWPLEWFAIIKNDPRYLPPIFRIGGFLMLLALLRWKRPEAWLLLVTALLPQSVTYYYLLPLFTIPRNFAESLALAAVSTAGIYLGAVVMPHGLTGIPFYEFSGNVAMLSVYLPCLILLLIRENAPSAKARVSLPLMRLSGSVRNRSDLAPD